LVKTIVTTNMADDITAAYGVKLIEVLTGFKYIGEQIKWFEENNTYNYVFGLEESYGCLAGTHARDKDAVVAVMCLCEVAAWCKKNNKTLWDMMLEMYEKYGYYKEELYTITMKGKEGSEQIAAIMEALRANPPKEFANWKVLEMRDYKSGKTVNPETGEEGETGLPTSNVLYFDLSDQAWCCARPSGTEPKIKFYMGVKGSSLENANQLVKELTEALKAKIS
ncbi:MAG: phospho-sugar mutase, partial [Lachnospiraceae bacterium]|nr:phospho-sugar mutase [Lachnospiraceae bacterium]